MFLSYNYAQYIGIIDIIIFLALIVVLIVGFKKGFLLKTLSLINIIFGLVFAIAFCVKFANSCLHPWFGERMETSFFNNIMANETFASISSVEDASNVLQTLGIPKFISNIVISNLDVTGYELCESIATNIAHLATSAILIVISFLVLFIGFTIVIWLLKLFAKLLRTSKFVRIIDGILGVVLYSVLFYIVLQIIFTVIIIIYRKTTGTNGFIDFINYDILGHTGMIEGLKDAPFRMTRWLFENNFFGNLFGLLF